LHYLKRNKMQRQLTEQEWIREFRVGMYYVKPTNYYPTEWNVEYNQSTFSRIINTIIKTLKKW